MSDRSDLGAVVLAGTLDATAAPAAVIEALISVPAIYRTIRAVRAPLDLDADEFRYRVDADGRITPMRPRGAAARSVWCGCPHPHLR